ncbi:hypothetical protein TREMEDRAFT_27514, partial [Tremella mesenterica DSM 1558]|uniref:uncharacterized protein n=1 Tax=Tremella mesenterica (strain ATCC 24925 / CBS 8224 / DSM 1558 / NBRC 9311 / NRRL Y-6157 / RJB 2259-6 / UBC 559-6) TaxID=578456 RepID=UPI0003F4A00E
KFPHPIGGAALPITFHPSKLPTLVVGSNRLASTRVYNLLEADAIVLVVSPQELSRAHDEIIHRSETRQIQYQQLNFEDMKSWIDFLSFNRIGLVCVTDTLIGSSQRSQTSAEIIFKACTSLHIPINISDNPSLSTYTFPSVHRYPGVDGKPSNLQISVSTNGRGCRLSGRIKREIISKLPSAVGAAVDNVGRLRERAKSSSHTRTQKISEDDIHTPLNDPVPQLNTKSLLNLASRQLATSITETKEEDTQLRRMRWVHQMSEYYSFESLARMTEEEMDHALETWSGTPRSSALPHHESPSHSSIHPYVQSSKKGQIYLVGSGPGHPSLLTVAAHKILRNATMVLSDKLVPSEILALIPSHTTLHIAKKFPGNAEGAQNEMMQLALSAAQKGEIVVRLKQGDPFVYGRGGEEVLFLREHGFESIVIPGLSSALAGPLMMGIPVTQRGVSESFIMCTGVGRQGKSVKLPGYVRSRTLAILMGVARIRSIIEVLTSAEEGRDGKVYPRYLPIAVIERASSKDQRVVLSTLENVEEALKSLEERPPGMMLVGWAVMCLEGKGRVDILDSNEEDEESIVNDWLRGQRWKVNEGLDKVWEEMSGE